MVQIASNVDQVKQHLNVPMKEFMSEGKIANILKEMPDKMTILKLKLETGARDFVHSNIDSINAEQIAIEKLNHEVANVLAYQPNNEAFKKAFSHWAADKHTKVDHLKKVEGSIPAMQSYYNQLHTTFEKHMSEVEKARSNIEQGIVSANVAFDKLHGSNSKVTKEIVEEARLKMDTVTENQAKMRKHLGIVMTVLIDYDVQRTIWAEYIIGKKDSVVVPPPTHVDEVISSFNSFKL